MRRSLLIPGFVAALTGWSTTGFAQLPRQQIVGPPPPSSTTLNANGSTYGVDMINETSTGTLVVPDGNNIFTNNASLGSSVPAVTTSATSTGNIMFLGNSTVFGAIGKSEPVGPYLLGVTGGANGTTVTFLGPVFDTTTYVSGSGTLNFDAATNQSPGGLIYSGDGTVALAAGTFLNAAGGVTTTAGTNTGTLVLGGGSTLERRGWRWQCCAQKHHRLRGEQRGGCECNDQWRGERLFLLPCDKYVGYHRRPYAGG